MFKPFGEAVEKQFKDMSRGELFIVDIDGNELWEEYLKAFPEGTDPIFRERTEHDCVCCRNFVKNLGKVVSIVDDKVQTVWEVEVDSPYKEVAAKLDRLVRDAQIVSLYRTKEEQYGKGSSLETIDGKVHTWYHFVGHTKQDHNAATTMGNYNSTVSVLNRALEELSESSLETVLDLINSKSIYRGDEFKTNVESFLYLLKEYNKLCPTKKGLFAWSNSGDPQARFKNTVIGTLVSDLSGGMELEKAVGKFESKVAPHNYKRPTSLITPAMIKKATETIEKLRLEPALHRRFANISDITVNNVLFVDGSVKGKMKGELESLLLETVKPKKPERKNVEEISIADFMANIVPKSKTIELFLQNSMVNNFMSITAPVNTCDNLFKWDNNFAWSYDGNITDSSIKQRVKKAGGNIDRNIRVSLSWFNRDDLDIHVYEPNNNHIYHARPDGKLDVDMNVSNPVRNAVENVCWDKLVNGKYRVTVHNYSRRESIDIGFELEVEINGVISSFSYNKGVPNKGTIPSIDLVVKDGNVDIITHKDIVEEAASKEKWDVNTEQLVKVDTILLSPNHWDGQEIGNKHWFFVLDKCKNPEQTRGFYNEFLKSDLEQHRKVFEVLGDKLKCPMTDKQLSGVGFSSTKKESVEVLANNKFYKVMF